MEGCDYLLHVASPISLERQDEDYFIKPAIDGVNRALKKEKSEGENMCQKLQNL